MSDRLIADEQNPIRVSGLGKLLQCSFSVKAMFDKWIEDHAGPTAQTGTVLHAGVEHWHKTGRDIQAAIRAMESSKRENPEADIRLAGRQFEHYIRDPRNINANIVLNEHRITRSIGNDDMGRPVFISGKLDQLRLEDNGLRYVYDVKSSSRMIGDLMFEYSVSQLMYSWLAEQETGEPVHGGYLILTQGYLKKTALPPEHRPSGVFVQMPLTRAHYSAIITLIVKEVSRLRRGDAHVNPGSHCHYCGFSGPQNCLLEIGLKT